MVFSPLGRIQNPHVDVPTRPLHSFLRFFPVKEMRAGTYPKSILLVSPKSLLVFALFFLLPAQTYTRQNMERKSRWRLRVLLNWLFLWLFVNFFCYFLLPSLVFFLAYHHSCVDNIFSIQSTFLRYTYILSTELMVSFCLYEEDRVLILVWLTLRQCKIERIMEKNKKSLWFRHFCQVDIIPLASRRYSSSIDPEFVKRFT
jgi:hypothetical protein